MPRCRHLRHRYATWLVSSGVPVNDVDSPDPSGRHVLVGKADENETFAGPTPCGGRNCSRGRSPIRP